MLWVENRTRPPFYQVHIDLFPYHTFIKHCGVTSEWQGCESSELCVPIFVLLTVVSAGHCPLHLVCSIPLSDATTINTFLLLMGRFCIFFLLWSVKLQASNTSLWYVWDPWDIFIGWYAGLGCLGRGGHNHSAFQKVLCVPQVAVQFVSDLKSRGRAAKQVFNTWDCQLSQVC